MENNYFKLFLDDLTKLWNGLEIGQKFGIVVLSAATLIIASFLVIAVMAFIVIMMSTKLTQTAISAMALLTAGIAMNMSERVQYGYVIDYIDCNFLPSFPVFNTADIMIVCGAIGLIMAILTRR